MTRVFFTTLACLLSIAPVVSGADKPNILLILADDLGYGDVECYNSEAKAPTPNLDRMASEGMRFTDAHSPSTVCTPTRYSIMTGRMAFRLNYAGVFTGVGGPCLITKRPTDASRYVARSRLRDGHVRQVAYRHVVSRSQTAM